jgi:ribosome biogenesis protein ERB1
MTRTTKTQRVSEPEITDESNEGDLSDALEKPSVELDHVEEVSTDNFSSSDDSDDEVVLNRSGSIPAHWYESEEHRGYDAFGKKVVKTLMSSKIDELLKNAEDPNRWRTVQDLQNEREIYLTDADIEIIRRLRAGHYPDGKVSDEGYFVEYDDTPHQLHPVRNKDLPKSRFLASKDENKEIRRLVKLIRAGKLIPGRTNSVKSDREIFDIWAQSEEEEGRIRGPAPLPAPKLPLPGHAESYHPPEEFLFSEEEKSQWLAGDDSTRPTTYIPENYPCLRRVPWYKALITERFSRCLDLYTVPRMLKKKMNVDPESLLPKLPQISDLRPFPSTLSVEFFGHSEPVTSISPSCLGDWVASVSSDSIRIWEVMTGKCIMSITEDIKNPTSVAWHPRLPLVAVGDEDGYVHFIVLSELALSQEIQSQLDSFMEISPEVSADNWRNSSKSVKMLTFSYCTNTPISSICWHHKGNFLAIVSAQSPSRDKSCCVMSIGNKKHVSPLKGKTQSVSGGARHVIFHPSKPYLVVSGSSNIAIFDLKTQNRVKILNSNSNSVSSVAIHPAGDGTHVLASSMDSKMIWFDSEVRDKPWKNFRHHGTSGVRKVSIHSRAATTLPLAATAGDDKSCHVVYSKVHVDDASKNPMVVPVKRLNHPQAVRDCQWHPTLPWLFTACDDGVVRLWA